MFGLVTKWKYEQDMLTMESENICLSRQNEGLRERIQLGEDYRAQLQLENKCVKERNRDLILEADLLKQRIADMESEIAKKDHELQEERLIRGSLEANWGRSVEI